MDLARLPKSAGIVDANSFPSQRQPGQLARQKASNAPAPCLGRTRTACLDQPSEFSPEPGSYEFALRNGLAPQISKHLSARSFTHGLVVHLDQNPFVPLPPARVTLQ